MRRIILSLALLCGCASISPTKVQRALDKIESGAVVLALVCAETPEAKGCAELMQHQAELAEALDAAKEISESLEP